MSPKSLPLGLTEGAKRFWDNDIHKCKNWPGHPYLTNDSKSDLRPVGRRKYALTLWIHASCCRKAHHDRADASQLRQACAPFVSTTRKTIRDTKRTERLALYLGAEGEGLPESLLARLRTVRIDMAEGFDSLNVAAASAIALHHFSASST
ncbi:MULTISPECIES: TrmH family RNA methyltransferase [unclassified Mesorhizobium]|uniref:TrmH family RNA methyltransferase n=1 Tax=unclassified Mesorhizobium TaxID=325217 RepID=UPI00247ABFE8|nr:MULTISPECIES: TrmH family RNA methyltransferase [unclassified Mesorhizobium]